MYKPTWSDLQKDIVNAGDADKEREITDAMMAEKDKELATSKKARDWENDRKEEYFAYKPEWKKKKLRDEKLADPSLKLRDEIKNGGSHDAGLQPARGYLLVKKDTEDAPTPSGIFVSYDDTHEPNTGVVLAVGDDLILDKYVVPKPVHVGAKVLLKKFCGMEITLKGEQCHLVQFSDVLGELA